MSKIVCPYCRTTSPNSDTHMMNNPQQIVQPTDGDVSVCFQCSSVSRYDSTEPGGLRRVTDEELAEIRQDPEAAHVINCVAEVVRTRAARGLIPGSKVKQ